MFKKIEPQSVKEASLGNNPDFYQSMANNALKDRLGSGTTYSGFMKIVGQKEFTITVGAESTVTTTTSHGVSSSIPFVFLYLKVAGYYTRVGFRTTTQSDPLSKISGIGNAVIDNRNYSFSITNFALTEQVYYLKALIFEVNN